MKEDKIVSHFLQIDNDINSTIVLDKEEAKFVRMFKGKLPFKCFECGRIGHYASKFSYAMMNNNNDSILKSKHQKNNYVNMRKKFYSEEQSVCESKEGVAD